jgi:hypothetical protein
MARQGLTEGVEATCSRADAMAAVAPQCSSVPVVLGVVVRGRWRGGAGRGLQGKGDNSAATAIH